MDIASKIPDPAAGRLPPQNSAAFNLSLKAISAIYRTVAGIRNRAYDRIPSLSHAAKFPVVSVGGIRAGGTGKTPVAALIGERLAAQGLAVAFLSRGYRRQESACRIVKPGEQVSWQLVGDEPKLLHNRVPGSWLGIDKDRNKTASLLAEVMPHRSVFILDDGFQHRAIRRDIDIVCLHHNFFADRVIPAGYLREPISSLGRAHIALLIGTPEQAEGLKRQRDRLAAAFPHLVTAVVTPQPGAWVNAGTGETCSRPPLDHPALLCGIARPERFISMARECGISPASIHTFSDHHPFKTEFFERNADLLSDGIITTEKDAIRLAALPIVPAKRMWYLKIELLFPDKTDETGVFSLIASACNR